MHSKSLLQIRKNYVTCIWLYYSTVILKFSYFFSFLWLLPQSSVFLIVSFLWLYFSLPSFLFFHTALSLLSFPLCHYICLSPFFTSLFLLPSLTFYNLYSLFPSIHPHSIETLCVSYRHFPATPSILFSPVSLSSLHTFPLPCLHVFPSLPILIPNIVLTHLWE